MRPHAMLLTIVGMLAAILPAPAYAQQQLSLHLGGFVVRGEDARGQDDVLNRNLSVLTFDPRDFNHAFVGGEWLVGLVPHVEGGVGIGLFSKSVPSTYTALVNEDGSEIRQDLKLRIAPITMTVRFLPASATSPIQPYIGAGVGILLWRYSETGQFVDADSNIFRASYAGDGASAGPVILGGVRVPIGRMSFGVEVRHLSGEGKLPAGQGFGGPRIDLGGMSYLATINWKF